MKSISKQNKSLRSLPFLTQKNEHQNKEYIKEYIHILLIAVVFCTLVATITHDPADPSFFTINSASDKAQFHITNTFGPLGATLSDWLFQLFGIGAIVFLFVFLAQLLNTFRRPKEKSRFYLRLFGYPQLIFCYLGLCSALSQHISFRGAYLLTGGYLGHGIHNLFQHILGSSGAFIALSIGLLSSLTLALGIRPLSFVFWLTSFPFFRKAKHFVDAVQETPHNVPPGHPNPRFGMEPTLDVSPFLDDHHFAPEPHAPYTETKHHTTTLIECLEYRRTKSDPKHQEWEMERIQKEAGLIEEKLASFGIKGSVVRSLTGPVVNVHEFEPAPGIKVNKILVLQDDLALALKAESLLIGLEPGRSAVSLEVPASQREIISLREMLESQVFQNQNSPLPLALGKGRDGQPLVVDLSAMPHMLIAGSTGSGKSVCLHTMLLSLLLTKNPRQLRLLLIDPKMLELSNYNDIGHLLMPVITDPNQATGALRWLLQEMDHRYALMKQHQVRSIVSYNALMESQSLEQSKAPQKQILPYLVVVIDEVCDLMMTAPKDVEDCVQRLAQKARAAGIHLILATQRPSVDVLTGVIKANLPCRLSFQVTSRHDSRTILETVGAERLLGKGDMLFLPPGLGKLTRAQGAFVTDKEINAVSDKLRLIYPARYEHDMMKHINRPTMDTPKQKTN